MEKYKLLINGKEIPQPDNASICFENLIKREKPESISLPGKIVKTEDKHTLEFCFDRGGIVHLHFKEPLSDEAVKEFVEKGKLFTYSYCGQ